MLTSSFSPILERELRLKARTWTTFAIRAGAGAVGVVLSLQQLLLTASMRTPAALGRAVFDSLVAAAFVLSCSGCILSSSSVAGERRQGTLGLLFLTNVKSFDVILGKLASSGLVGLCAVLAFMPAMALPLLAGGVSGWEAARKGGALAMTLWFALGAGLCGAAAQPARSKGAVGALLIVCFFALVPFLCAVLGGGGVWHYAGMLSPLVLMIAAGDSRYGAAPEQFWISLLVVHCVGWLLLVLAARLLRGAIRRDHAVVRRRPPKPKTEAKRALGLGRWRPDRNDSEPIEWLVYRDGISSALWLVGLLGLVASRLTAMLIQPRAGAAPGLIWFLALPLGLAPAALGGCMLAMVATRFFTTVRQTGELELLLTTPVGAKTILSDQWQVLKRMFIWPVLVMQVGLLVPVLSGTGISTGPYLLLRAGLNTANTVLGTVCLCYLAMGFGLRSSSQSTAIFWTVTLAQGVPWLILLSLGVIPFLADAILVVFYVCLLAAAKSRLEKDLSPAAALPLRLARILE